MLILSFKEDLPSLSNPFSANTIFQIVHQYNKLGDLYLMKIHFLILLLTFVQCSELFNKSSSDNSKRNAAAGFLLLSQSGGCTQASVNTIGSTTRTEYNFSGVNCVSGLATIGFVGENLQPGLSGTSTSSRLASLTSFATSGGKKMNIEVTYTINSSSGYLDVIGNASVSGSIATGPTFRIKPNTISIVTSFGQETAIGTGTVPSSPVSTEKTICLEIHEENGAHMFGWNSACASVANRATYDFEQESVVTTNPGSQVGFVLNNATLKKIIVSRGAIGTAGQILEVQN